MTRHRMTTSNRIRDGTRVVVIGAGPSGGVFSVLFLERCRAEGIQVELTLVDRKDFASPGPRGCNMSAGILAHSFLELMRQHGLVLPEAAIQRRIRGYRLQGRSSGLTLDAPLGTEIVSAYRGGGPLGVTDTHADGLDTYLLRRALDAGARYLPRLVVGIERSPSAPSSWQVVTSQHEMLLADVVVAACGVNTPLLRELSSLGLGYRPPALAHSCQAEIELPESYIAERFGDRVHIFLPGIPHIEFVAATPKRRYLTITVVGRHPRHEDLEWSLQHPPLRDYLPKTWEMPERYCQCYPRLPLTSSRHPYGPGLVVIGDANVSRYLKNGLYSAFLTARMATEALLEDGYGEAALRRSYAAPCRKTFHWDNLCGRALFLMNRVITRLPTVTAIHLRVARDEQVRRPAAPHAITRVLWNMFSGDAPYCESLMSALSPGAQWALLVAALQQSWEVVGLNDLRSTMKRRL